MNFHKGILNDSRVIAIFAFSLTDFVCRQFDKKK